MLANIERIVTRRVAGQHGVLDVAGHVGRGLHIRGDAVRRAHVPRRARHARPARQDLQGGGHADGGELVGRVAAARAARARGALGRVGRARAGRRLPAPARRGPRRRAPRRRAAAARPRAPRARRHGAAAQLLRAAAAPPARPARWSVAHSYTYIPRTIHRNPHVHLKK